MDLRNGNLDSLRATLSAVDEAVAKSGTWGASEVGSGKMSAVTSQ